MKRTGFLTITLLTGGVYLASAQQNAKPEDTEFWEPVPKVVTPGKANAAPSDAIVLFNGKDLSEWVSSKDNSAAKWTVSDGVFTVKKGTGNIQTKKSFTNYQLHLEWKIPANITGSGQARGKIILVMDMRETLTIPLHILGPSADPDLNRKSIIIPQ